MKPSLLGSADVPCVQCDRRERGLAWGDYCSVCRRERENRSSRIAHRAAAAAALVMAIWLLIRVPPRLGPRAYAAVTLVLTYAVVRKIVWRVAMEFLPRHEHVETGDQAKGT